jgi:hypothetical protein
MLLAINQLPQEQHHEVIGSLFLFALVWSFGAVVDLQSRTAFDVFLRRQCIGMDKVIPFPKLTNESVYDFYFDFTTMNWKKWMEDPLVKEFALPEGNTDSTF